MKLLEMPRIEIRQGSDDIVIPLQKGSFREIAGFMESLSDLPIDKEIVVKIEVKKKKRSLDANAYFWTLIGRLGDKLGRSSTEIYWELIKDNGVFTIVPIAEEGVDFWIKHWGDKGLGWLCVDMGPCKNTRGYHNIKSYYGTSCYDTKQMARIIDAVVYECRQQGIETETPEEIERIKSLWQS